ncbi:mercury(II) reductase [Candidatus Marsarchaeota archaeon]|nr:mercury(II) reductase [Candidatus Marsarchaeota archaeon]MCL5404728.1 mercury(II) reductase [Candidatus Marsarchaeota archaeon]
MEKFDYAIIGQGAAAFAAAIKANELGKNTVMIGKNATEGATLGGTCVNVGCVPSKRMITVARFARELKVKRFRGFDYDKGSLKYKEIVQEKDDLVKGFHESKYENVMDSLEKVTYLNEFGSLQGAGRIKAGSKEIEAGKILIATGARSFIPKVQGIETVKCLDNESALSLKELPESMVVIGGRAIGLEFAQMFSMFGTKVTVLQRSPTILPNWEPTISKHLDKYLRDDGIDIRTNVEVKSVAGSSGRTEVKALVNGKEESFVADKLLMATGRTPNTEKLGLKNVNLETNDKGFIKIDGMMQTNVKGIYAAGDVTGNPMLETLAAKEGNIATQNMFGNKKVKIDLNEVPSAVFTEPEAAMVGRTEEQVIKDLNNCGCNALPMALVPKAGIISDTRGVIKVVINPKTHEILGAHMLGHGAADLIHEAVMAVKFHMKLEDIIDTVHVFPTMSEGFKLACQSFFADVSKQSCCTV